MLLLVNKHMKEQLVEVYVHPIYLVVKACNVKDFALDRATIVKVPTKKGHFKMRLCTPTIGDNVRLGTLAWGLTSQEAWKKADIIYKPDECPTSEEFEQLLFEHLNRRCNCGSGNVWSECNGFQGDSSYCG